VVDVGDNCEVAKEACVHGWLVKGDKCAIPARPLRRTSMA
jgi:hypothetical protein